MKRVNISHYETKWSIVLCKDKCDHMPQVITAVSMSFKCKVVFSGNPFLDLNQCF